MGMNCSECAENYWDLSSGDGCKECSCNITGMLIKNQLLSIHMYL